MSATTSERAQLRRLQRRRKKLLAKADALLPEMRRLAGLVSEQDAEEEQAWEARVYWAWLKNRDRFAGRGGLAAFASARHWKLSKVREAIREHTRRREHALEQRETDWLIREGYSAVAIACCRYGPTSNEIHASHQWLRDFWKLEQQADVDAEGWRLLAPVTPMRPDLEPEIVVHNTVPSTTGPDGERVCSSCGVELPAHHPDCSLLRTTGNRVMVARKLLGIA